MPSIERKALASYLAGVFHVPVEILALAPLKGEGGGDPKGLGYGVPLEVQCLVGGAPRALVAPAPFDLERLPATFRRAA